MHQEESGDKKQRDAESGQYHRNERHWIAERKIDSNRQTGGHKQTNRAIQKAQSKQDHLAPTLVKIKFGMDLLTPLCRTVCTFSQPDILSHLGESPHPIHDPGQAHETARNEARTCQDQDGRRDQGGEKS